MNSKNLIIIIGNGFDLAHGLKTSYNDFAEHLMHIIANKCIEIKDVLNLNEYSCPIISDEFIKNYQKLVNNGKYTVPHEYNSSDELGLVKFLLSRLGTPEKIAPFLLEKPELLNGILKNTFLVKLYRNQYNNWFDIENAYFTELKSLVKVNRNLVEEHLTKLNYNFQQIRTFLIEYLKTIEPKANPTIDFFLNNSLMKGKYESVYFLNFNYTNTLGNYYLNGVPNISKIYVNHIHGTLEEDIIFGYGNDRNPDYTKMKELEIDSFLTHFKTFKYLKNRRYIEVYEDFLNNSENYEAFVLGHSLGSTDKTLLMEILDNKKCRKIHLFKRRDLKDDKDRVVKEFDKLCYALSRIVSEDGELRKKVVNFKESRFFP